MWLPHISLVPLLGPDRMCLDLTASLKILAAAPTHGMGDAKADGAGMRRSLLRTYNLAISRANYFYKPLFPHLQIGDRNALPHQGCLPHGSTVPKAGKVG